VRLPAAGICLLAVSACGKPAGPPVLPTEVAFPGTAAVRLTPAGTGRWLVLFETLQAQALVTTPIRRAGLVGSGPGIVQAYDAPAGWVLIDAVAHPSGEVSLLSVRVDPAPAYPLRALVSRFATDGSRTDRELFRLLPPSGDEPPPAFLSSLDRARIVPHGEDLFAVVRWANNAVQAYRLFFEGRSLEERWAAWVEPAAPLFFIGIIGGGFDNFHQGDATSFVHADVDPDGNLYAAVVSTGEVVASHDAFFGEDLTSQTDPAGFDFGAAIVTGINALGVRAFARLEGSPGRDKRLLDLRFADGSLVLLGRIKTGKEPGSWDAWVHSSRAATGELRYERNLDLRDGDMFWDAAPLGAGRLVAVGSTGYTQNPSGLSVSDSRDALVVVLDANGIVERQLALPAGPSGRGNEAISVSAPGGNQIAICGVHNAPGTHAAVYSDAFLVTRNP
jgi:hypothetical protein